MVNAQDMEVEGITSFPSTTTTYRFSIQLKNDKISIWMEDRTSKKQWYKGNIAKCDYVTSANTITDASASDYVKCFHDALTCTLDGSSDGHRQLRFLPGNSLRLEFVMNVHIMHSTLVAIYTFDLEPVSVERIDVLESKLRD
ncbi:hypothetical protein PHMEG_00036734 [Phytophthora megakarya]|uniref:Uncharacterized protein n=1 Tax=Phytophthora megakarya TaxID=4795 RepID=A0A225ULE7_9STRA|nr:hypothetical protein PHMEG_00036734 [Phytophthora megakarya]